MLYKHREIFNRLSIKTGMVFGKISLTPNQWTIISLLPAFIAFYFLTQEQFLFAAISFSISALIDFVDGSVARVSGRVTKFGAYLDTIVDRLVEATIVFGLLFASLPKIVLPAYAWIFLYFCGSFTTTYAKAAAKEKDLVKEELKGGVLERAERLAILFAGIVLAVFSETYLVWTIILLAVLTNISALQRVLAVWKLSKNSLP